jgi:transcriptional regulator with XRE-family HTH domain
MPSGRKPNVRRRREVHELRGQGLSLSEIARRFGVSKQAVWGLLHARPRSPRVRAVACTACGAPIVSPGALRRDAVAALCLACLDGRPHVPFARRLQAFRLAAGLSQADLSRRSGVSPGAIRAYEEGCREPRRKTVDQLAHVLGGRLMSNGALAPPARSYSDAS